MVQFQSIPEQLKRCRFCCWKRVFRNGRLTKLPINPMTGRAACTNDPGSFGTFDQAKAAYERGYYDGLGILVDRIAAFDIDRCIREDGSLNDLATDVLAAFAGAYVEISPSGTGLRGFFTVRQDFTYTVTSVIRIYRKWCVLNSNGYAKTKKEFKETYAEYLNIPMDDAIVRRGQGSYFAHYRVTQEAYANLLPSDAEVHRDMVFRQAVL